MDETFLNTAQVAKRYKVDTETVRRWIRSNRLPAINLAPNGKRAQFRVRVSDLERFETLLSTQRVTKAAAPRRRTVSVKNLPSLPAGMKYY